MNTPANMHVVLAEAQNPQAWRNGGGQTRELLTWPEGADWRLRISRADIDRDGPFSAFPGVQRWFVVLHGAGVVLHFPGQDHTRRLGQQPLCFDGASAPGCSLLDGPTQDLNLMARQGRGHMQAVAPGEAWEAAHTVSALYTTGPGTWQCGPASLALAANSLLWCETANPASTQPVSAPLWTFTPHSTDARAWWLGYSPSQP